MASVLERPPRTVVDRPLPLNRGNGVATRVELKDRRDTKAASGGESGHTYRPSLSHPTRTIAFMAPSARKDIPAPVSNRLFALSGNQCAFPGCSNPVTHQEAPGERPVTTGERAHIVGVGRQGPRSKATPLADDPDAIENLTLFCGVHHPIVDGNPRIYSVEVLAKYKADHEAKMAPAALKPAPPQMQRELVDLSLLPVVDLPGHVWRARARYRTTDEIAAHLPRPKGMQVLPFVVNSGRVWAFHDLTQPKGPFHQVVDLTADVERVEAVSMLSSESRSIYVWLLNAALREALRRRGVRHDKRHDRYYFLADHETIARRVAAKTKTGRNQTAKNVVRREGERSENPRDVWWHLAAQLRFEEFGVGAWGLTIRPEFHLTSDGREPLDPRRVGRKVTKRKSRMYNEGYFDAVHFFRYFLLDGEARLTLRVGQQTISVGGDFPAIEATWPEIGDRRFDPLRMLDSDDEDDVLDAVAGTVDLEDEWDWGAEHAEDDR